MKKLMLASASALLFAGVAFAQTSTTPASPGTPPPSPQSTTGNPGATNVAPPTAPATPMANEKMPAVNPSPMAAPAQTPMQKSPMANQMAKPMHKAMARPMSHMDHMGRPMGRREPHMAMMPDNAPAGVYLHIAGQAIMAHNKMRAHEALGRAETDMLTGSYVQGSVNGPINTPEIATIEQARHAVMAGDYHTAMMMTHKAMTMGHGPMGHDAMGHGPMSHGPMSHGPMSHGPMSHGPMGHGPGMAPPPSK
jgi:hypothetical protein